MGNNPSVENLSKKDLGDKEWEKFVFEKRKKDASKHQRISTQDGTAFNKLMKQEDQKRTKSGKGSMDQFVSSSISCLPNSSSSSRGSSKSPTRIARNPKSSKEISSIMISKHLQNSPGQVQSQYLNGGGTSSNSNANTSASADRWEKLNDPKLAWVKQLILELESEKHAKTIYASKIIGKVDRLLASWSYKMDPSQFKSMYVNKVYRSDFSQVSSVTGANQSGQLQMAMGNANNRQSAEFAMQIESNNQDTQALVQMPGEQLVLQQESNFNSQPRNQQTHHYQSQNQPGEDVFTLTKQQLTASPPPSVLAQESDIIGLSVIEASSIYELKFNTLRQHLQISDHPIVKLIVAFREILLAHLKESESKIQQNIQIYSNDNPFVTQQTSTDERNHILTTQNAKLFTQVNSQVKLFTELMHDAVVRFYQLDVKTSFDASDCECLVNLITSLVLKSPVYSEVHQLIQSAYRKRYVNRCMKVISQMRKRPAFEEEIGVDVVKIGRSIYKSKHAAKESQEIDDKQARKCFESAVRKIEQVRNVSSPIGKVITLQQTMDQLMGLVSAHNEINDADVLFKTVFFILVTMRSEEFAHLGSRFIEDCVYIDAFMHENQVGMIQQYAYVQHFKTCLGIMLQGPVACIHNFIEEKSEEELLGLDVSPIEFVTAHENPQSQLLLKQSVVHQSDQSNAARTQSIAGQPQSMQSMSTFQAQSTYQESMLGAQSYNASSQLEPESIKTITTGSDILAKFKSQGFFDNLNSKNSFSGSGIDNQQDNSISNAEAAKNSTVEQIGIAIQEITEKQISESSNELKNTKSVKETMGQSKNQKHSSSVLCAPLESFSLTIDEDYFEGPTTGRHGCVKYVKQNTVAVGGFTPTSNSNSNDVYRRNTTQPFSKLRSSPLNQSGVRSVLVQKSSNPKNKPTNLSPKLSLGKKSRSSNNLIKEEQIEEEIKVGHRNSNADHFGLLVEVANESELEQSRKTVKALREQNIADNGGGTTTGSSKSPNSTQLQLNTKNNMIGSKGGQSSFKSNLS